MATWSYKDAEEAEWDGTIKAKRFIGEVEDKTINAAGSNMEIQYNDNGLLGASNAFIFSAAVGRVGIGTTGPGSTLNVKKSIAANLVQFEQDNVLGDGLYVVSDATASSRYVLALDGNNGATNVLWAMANGSVGIGTTSPAADSKLHVSGGFIYVSNRDTGIIITPTLAGGLFVSGGALWYVGSSGTKTLLGNP